GDADDEANQLIEHFLQRHVRSGNSTDAVQQGQLRRGSLWRVTCGNLHRVSRLQSSCHSSVKTLTEGKLMGECRFPMMCCNPISLRFCSFVVSPPTFVCECFSGGPLPPGEGGEAG